MMTQQTNSRSIRYTMAVTAIGVLLLGIYTFFAAAARDDIYYLCGNFKAGVSHSSVLRQLETVNLSAYRVENSEQARSDCEVIPVVIKQKAAPSGRLFLCIRKFGLRLFDKLALEHH